jgi:hypothetical protein
MTSLGLLQYSEISDNSVINSNMTEMEKKKQARHNITIKKRHEPGASAGANMNGNDNVQNMLKLINNSNGYENDDESGLVDFNPPPRAEVSTKTTGPPNNQAQNNQAQNTQVQAIEIDYEKPTTITQPPFDMNATENMAAMAVKPRQYPAPLDSYEGFNALPKTYASDYYKQYVPYFNQGASTGGSVAEGHMNKNQLLEKLNYMIHLLEEQKDEKTGHVMEEVILYSFLGVFIIFIVDSFARVGKYTR